MLVKTSENVMPVGGLKRALRKRTGYFQKGNMPRAPARAWKFQTGGLGERLSKTELNTGGLRGGRCWCWRALRVSKKEKSFLLPSPHLPVIVCRRVSGSAPFVWCTGFCGRNGLFAARRPLGRDAARVSGAQRPLSRAGAAGCAPGCLSSSLTVPIPPWCPPCSWLFVEYSLTPWTFSKGLLVA